MIDVSRLCTVSPIHMYIPTGEGCSGCCCCGGCWSPAPNSGAVIGAGGVKAGVCTAKKKLNININHLFKQASRLAKDRQEWRRLVDALCATGRLKDW